MTSIFFRQLSLSKFHHLSGDWLLGGEPQLDKGSNIFIFRWSVIILTSVVPVVIMDGEASMFRRCNGGPSLGIANILFS